MATYRVSLAFPADSALPKDIISINPHYGGDNPDALVSALKANIEAWPPTATHPFTIKVYDALKAPPSYPLASFTKPGTAPVSPHPREVAICLSYYSTYNRPRYRGRLYLPAKWFDIAPGLRPTIAVMDEVLTFGRDVLAKSLPANTAWVVYSKRNAAAYGVSHMWCDDEWDTVRSRGLKATTRQLATV